MYIHIREDSTLDRSAQMGPHDEMYRELMFSTVASRKIIEQKPILG